MVTYRVRDDSGLVLFFPDGSVLDRFQECCDAILTPANPLDGAAPTLEELGELGLINVPRIVGGYLDGTSLPTVLETSSLNMAESETLGRSEDDASVVSETDDGQSLSDFSSFGSLDSEFLGGLHVLMEGMEDGFTD